MSQLQNHNSSLFTIECEDIILREYRFEDLDDLYHLTWQPHFHEFLLDWNVSKEQREEWILDYEIHDNKRFLDAVAKDGNIGELRLRLGIISKDSGEFIGVCGTGILDKVSPPNREIYQLAENTRDLSHADESASVEA